MGMARVNVIHHYIYGECNLHTKFRNQKISLVFGSFVTYRFVRDLYLLNMSLNRA